MTRTATVKLSELVRFKEEWTSGAERPALNLGRGKISFRFGRNYMSVDVRFRDGYPEQYGHSIDGMDIIQCDARTWRLDPFKVYKDGTKHVLLGRSIVLRADKEYSGRKQSTLGSWGDGDE